jgi:opacity protein-like surface antigen
MERMTMRIKTLLMTAVLAVGISSIAVAQQSNYNPAEHKIELNAFGGYVWTWSQDWSAVGGVVNLDIKSSGYWGAAIDINVKYGTQLELLYRRQDSDLQVTQRNGFTLGVPFTERMSVEYFQIGGLAGRPQGNILPYGLFTLGATRFNNKDLNHEEWFFSVIVGLGVKVYATERLGLRFQGGLPISFTSGGAFFGTGGLSFGGTGITQTDVSAGLFLAL